MGIFLGDLEHFWHRFVLEVNRNTQLHLFDSLLTLGELAVMNMLFESGATVLNKNNLYVWVLRRKSFDGFYRIFGTISSFQRRYNMRNIGKNLLVTVDSRLYSLFKVHFGLHIYS